jgi:glycosyltransferase involved in cell wall biosynthesis
MSCDHSFHLGVNTLFHVPGDIGGTETYLREMLIAMASEFPCLSITLFTHHDNDQVVRDWLAFRDDIQFVRLPFPARIRPLRIVLEQSFLPFYVARGGVDVLWSPGYTAPFWVPCKQVVTIHDLQYKRFPEDMTSLERLVLNVLVRVACYKCDAILVVSNFSKNEIVSFGFAPVAKIHTVHAGVNRCFAESVDDELVLKNLLHEKFPTTTPFILCVAHTYPHKNVDVLIEAYGEIADNIPHNLVLVGKPRRGEGRVQDALSRLQPKNRFFRFSQGVSFDQLRWLYQSTDLFVLPSLYEGFGLPVIEALMAGAPVICSKEASLPEVGGKYPCYLDSITVETLARVMQEVLQKSDRVSGNALSGSAWAEKFDWRTSARRALAVFNGCLDK